MKRPLKIIALGPSWPYRGGPASFTDRLARQFSDEGHNIELITFTLQYPGILFPGKSQYTEAPAPEGISVSRELNSVNPFSWIKTGLKIRRKRPDILLVRYWLPFMAPSFGTVAKIVRAGRKTRIICIFDNVVPHEKRPGDRILTKYFIRKIDGAVVMSDSVMKDLRKFSTHLPVRLNPHPLFDNYGPAIDRNNAAETLKLDPSFSYILFFGFIRAYKGLDLLLEAMGDERLKGRNLKLLVAGEFYEDEKPYREQIARLQLDERVVLFNNFIKDEDVSAFFSVSDMVVQPYKSATQSGVTQVAFHFVKPMLVTDVGGLRELVADGSCGYVVERDSSAIAGAIADFYDNDRSSEFTEGVKKEREKFSWNSMTKAILAVYDECSTKS